MTELLETLKQQVIDALNLEDLTPEDIDVDAPDDDHFVAEFYIEGENS